MSPKTRLKIEVSRELAQELPLDPAARSKILEIGLREWRIREALESYRQGTGTLAHAAQKARIPLREMIPHAYAYGLTPKVDPTGCLGSLGGRSRHAMIVVADSGPLMALAKVEALDLLFKWCSPVHIPPGAGGWVCERSFQPT